MTRIRLVLALIAAAASIAIAVSLGNWQTRRGDAKLALQAPADRVEQARPVEIAASSASIEDIASALPRKVRVSGTFDGSGTIYLDNRALEGAAGFYVITPLIVAEALPALLVDRGWTGRDSQDRARVEAAPPASGRVLVEGIAVASPSRLFEFGDSADRRVPGIWQNLDYAAYEQATGRRVARFVIRQKAETVGTSATDTDGLRREWPKPASGVDKHRGYAFQWYSLAALIAVLVAWFGLKAWRLR